MASKVEGEKLQGLVCPLCLDVFENATILTCGHTFCKECLEAYDEQSHELSYIVCPVCRDRTELGQDRVAGLTPNFSVKGLVDKINVEDGRRRPVYCSLHNALYKDIFCEDCAEFICLSCYIHSHKEHVIKKKEELERNLKERRNTLIRRKARRFLLERSLSSAEEEGNDANQHLSGLEKEIRDAFVKKLMKLQEQEGVLLKMVKEMRKAQEETVAGSAWFSPADDTLIALGHIELGEDSSVEEKQEVGSASPVRCNDTDALQTSALIDDSMKIVREIELPKGLAGMSALSKDAVVVGYGWNAKGSDCFSVCGNQIPHLKSDAGNVYDIAMLADGRTVVSRDVDVCLTFDRKGRQIRGLKYVCNKAGLCPMICSDQEDNIYAVNRSSEINIFQGSKGTPRRVVHTGSIKPSQICVTSTGIMITCTCIMTPSTVTVFDRDGHVGSSITASDDTEYLLAAVDSQDSVLVARVRVGSDTICLTRYTLDGTRLTEQVCFKPLQLHARCQSFWSYMVSLTPNMLAFKSKRRLYFIEIVA
ncbi:tripartite motif-containing protein 15-like [Lytechinus variegatus]|uniref:tripartite motif-containing protein 15-like n=1 Tax=Lytechinus variegatus TaxID=7654 RepID=UPI001BB0DC47|nr:tripartite motif-containing protein 15-like [Lytechinus variegatus]